MNILKYLPFVLALIILDAHAETIEVQTMISERIAFAPKPNGSVTPACFKVVFINRNAGKLIAGLTAAKLKFLSASKTVLNKTTAKFEASPVTIRPSLTRTTQPGFYKLCVTPVGFTWTLTANPTYYDFDFIVNGVAAVDHGVFSLHLEN